MHKFITIATKNPVRIQGEFWACADSLIYVYEKKYQQNICDERNTHVSLVDVVTDKFFRKKSQP